MKRSRRSSHRRHRLTHLPLAFEMLESRQMLHGSDLSLPATGTLVGDEPEGPGGVPAAAAVEEDTTPPSVPPNYRVYQL